MKGLMNVDKGGPGNQKLKNKPVNLAPVTKISSKWRNFKIRPVKHIKVYF